MKRTISPALLGFLFITALYACRKDTTPRLDRYRSPIPDYLNSRVDSFVHTIPDAVGWRWLNISMTTSPDYCIIIEMALPGTNDYETRRQCEAERDRMISAVFYDTSPGFYFQSVRFDYWRNMVYLRFR